MKIHYDIEQERQGLQECVQASAIQILSYYGIKKTLADVKKEVPVYVDEFGINRGTSLGHIATYFQELGLRTKLHTVDLIVFDRSWISVTKNELIANLKLRERYVKHGWYDQKLIKVMINGYTSYIKSGGSVLQPVVDVPYILSYLEKGPLYFVVSYNSLNNCSKYDFSKENEQDPIKGLPSTHAIVVSGYENGFFEIVDPDFNFGGYRKISASQLIAAYYLAETDTDCLFISIEK